MKKEKSLREVALEWTFILLVALFSLNIMIIAYQLVESGINEIEIKQLETKLNYERYEKQMQRIQYEQLKTCVITEARMRELNPLFSITADCYRYVEQYE